MYETMLCVMCVVRTLSFCFWLCYCFSIVFLSFVYDFLFLFCLWVVDFVVGWATRCFYCSYCPSPFPHCSWSIVLYSTLRLLMAFIEWNAWLANLLLLIKAPVVAHVYVFCVGKIKMTNILISHGFLYLFCLSNKREIIVTKIRWLFRLCLSLCSDAVAYVAFGSFVFPSFSVPFLSLCFLLFYFFEFAFWISIVEGRECFS